MGILDLIQDSNVYFECYFGKSKGKIFPYTWIYKQKHPVMEKRGWMLPLGCGQGCRFSLPLPISLQRSGALFMVSWEADICLSATRRLEMKFFHSGGMLAGSCTLQWGLFCTWLSHRPVPSLCWPQTTACFLPASMASAMRATGWDPERWQSQDASGSPNSLLPWIPLSTIYSWTLICRQKTTDLLLPSLVLLFIICLLIFS